MEYKYKLLSAESGAQIGGAPKLSKDGMLSLSINTVFVHLCNRLIVLLPKYSLNTLSTTLNTSIIPPPIAPFITVTIVMLLRDACQLF